MNTTERSDTAAGATARAGGPGDPDAGAGATARAPDGPLAVPVFSLAAAVERHVADGDCVWLGNFGCQLFAVGRELIRQARRDLHVVAASGGILLDQLIAAGVVGAATFAHCWSPVGPQPTRAFRRAWEQDAGAGIAWQELSVATIVAALAAGAQGVPFAPVALDERTGYVADGWSGGALARAQSPFGEATVVRALVPDVAFVHAVAADRWGNAALGAPAGEAPVAAQAARRVVVVAEELVATPGADAANRGAADAIHGADAANRGAADAIRGAPGADRGAIVLPGVLVDAIAIEPGAAAPDGVAGRYPRDVEAYLAYRAPEPAAPRAPASAAARSSAPADRTGARA